MPRLLVAALVALVALVALATLAIADARVRVTPRELVVREPIHFEVGKATIKSSSYAILDAVVAAMKRETKLGLVEIGVHTDARGNDAYNLEMSQKRAQAIYEYLVGKGVAAGRLRAKGYGETRPIDKGTSARAMARNRRTVFTILQRA